MAEFIYSTKAKITLIPVGSLFKPLSALADKVNNFKGDGFCVLTKKDIDEVRTILVNIYSDAGFKTGTSTMQPVKSGPAGPAMVPDP